MTETELFAEVVRETVELVKRSGHGPKGMITVSPDVAALLDRVRAASAPIQAPSGATHETPSPSEDTAAAVASAASLDEVARLVSACQRCGLHTTRKTTVPGAGNPNADIVFVGEAPGEEEDRQGLPFVGRAGQLLTDIIEKGMKLRREDVFICNVLKCRPPDNRDPNPEEVRCCEPYLLRQLELIQPKVICALGRHAAQTLLKTTESTGKLRNRWHRYHDIPLRVTYHPAYLLRSPAEKRKAWEDVKEILKLLHGQENPGS
jgi:uracil-DNA glycosylase